LDDLLERLGVPSHVFPEVVEPGTVLAPLSDGVAEESGLGRADVVAVATTDAEMSSCHYCHPVSLRATWVEADVVAVATTDAETST